MHPQRLPLPCVRQSRRRRRIGRAQEQGDPHHQPENQKDRKNNRHQRQLSARAGGARFLRQHPVFILQRQRRTLANPRCLNRAPAFLQTMPNPTLIPPITSMKKSLLAFRILPALALLAFIFSTAAQAGIIVNADFEKGVPPEIKSFQSSVEIDTTRARSGNASLRVTKKDKTTWGTAFFNLDGLMNFPDGCEFSLWVYGERGSKISAYISAADPGKSGRYTAVSAIGTIKNGQWSKLRGKIYPGDLGRGERDVRLIIRTHGTCWIDDVRLTSGSSTASPAQAWPEVETAMHKTASRRVTAIKPGDAVTLDARNAALVPDTALAQTTLPNDTAVAIPAEGILVFAIDAKDEITLAGTLQLEPDADLRPGLRATVLANNTVIAAPAVKADAPWRDVRTEDRPGALPNITGQRPSPPSPLRPSTSPRVATISPWPVRTSAPAARSPVSNSPPNPPKNRSTPSAFSPTPTSATDAPCG
ncbi:hypothetical protein CKA38_11910 [Ereboglobus luteus]|uniref:CBM-cenC domain-containing protein n=2 Tax=Ereboglobus luteus TaxID=1796921 RepID=A0A2U8E4L0_9BACT|nr:hypothetical protein CKA38_11910 [Ereboglobus luteus]